VISVSSSRPASRLILWSAVVCFCWTVGASSARLDAEDRAAEFLEGLRQRGWHDVASEYLEVADQDPIAGQAFLDRLEYERATTLSLLAKNNASSHERQQLLEQAVAGFKHYAEEHRDSAQGVDALSQAGKLLTEQALLLMAKADRLPAQATTERNQFGAEARKIFSTASTAVTEMLVRCEKQLSDLPKAAQLQANPEALATRQMLRSKQAEGRFLLANLEFEKAQSYSSDSSQRKPTLEAAAKAFSKLHEDYADKRVGFFGRLYEGRCHQAASNYKAALACYEDVVEQPTGDADYRRLIARAYRRRAECYLADGNFEKVIEECQDWLNSAVSNEQKQPEWLAVSYRLASAYQMKAQEVESASEARQLQKEARSLYREVSSQPGEFQNEARVAQASTTRAPDKPISVKSFDDAFAAGKDALDQMNSTKLAARLAAENNPSAVEELQQQAAENQAAALGYFQKAIEQANGKTPVDELVEARYYLCWLHWEEQQYAEAAELGELLAREHAENKFAPVAAKLALAAYERLDSLARQAGESDNNHGKQLQSIAELIMQRWPESAETGVAANLLINIALRENRTAEAEKLLEQLPATGRAAAELSLGGSMWNRFQQHLRENQGAPSDEGQKLRKRATELLASGYQTLRNSESATIAQATGLLYYVQLLLADGKFDLALEVLEHPSVGPLSLARKSTDGKQRPEFIQEVYKAALRAYVSVDPPRNEAAEKLMDSLDRLTLGQADAEQQLTKIYISLGLQLQRQLKDLTDAGKKDKARDVAATFADLLGRVSRRSDVSDWRIRSWVAQTNLQLGEGLDGEEGAQYLSQAEDAYRGLIDEVEKDPKYAPSPQAILAVRKHLGDCLRAREQYEAAYEQYSKILNEKPSILELQQATAMVLQQWGIAEQNSEKIEQAIRGALPQANQKNLIWGWLHMAKIADYQRRKAERTATDNPVALKSVAKYEDLFFSARYNAAKARFESAKIANDPKQLSTVRQSLKAMMQLYPKLGGPKWKAAFAELLLQVEQAQ